MQQIRENRGVHFLCASRPRRGEQLNEEQIVPDYVAPYPTLFDSSSIGFAQDKDAETRP